jgi:outer membrane receptor protein involved in Fe transport
MRTSSQKKSFSAVMHIAAAFLVSALGLSLVGRAQAQDAATKDQQPLEEITVTGSRIVRTSGFSTPVPVTAVTAEELHTLKPGTTLTDQLGLLPQFYNTQSAQRGGGALFGTAGGSYLDLRSLGPQRTLILLDGARVAPADRSGSVNVDNFPTALLRSVEVVTGGASAAYGADALAGVTNFIINRDFRGLNVSAEAGATSFGDGNNMGVSIVGGTELTKRWSFVGSFEHQNIDQIRRDPDEVGDWFRPGARPSARGRRGNSCCPTFTPRCIRRPERFAAYRRRRR